MSESRNPPAAVARALRKEAGFGCVNCGEPFVVYHHIVPWEEEHHFRIADMVAVCPTCHDRFHAMPRDKQYRLKRSPHNLKKGVIGGILEVSSNLISFQIGRNTITNCPLVIGFEFDDLFSWRIEDEEFKLSIHIQGPSGATLLRIVDNEILFQLGNFWDIRFSYNKIQIWTKSRKKVVTIDLRRTPAVFVYETYIAGKRVRIDKDQIVVGGQDYSLTAHGNVFDSLVGYAFHFFVHREGQPVRTVPGSGIGIGLSP